MHQYSGPGSQEFLTNGISALAATEECFEAYLAQHGYISVCVDGRGTGGRGSDFEKSTYLKIGIQESEDQVEAAKYLSFFIIY